MSAAIERGGPLQPALKVVVGSQPAPGTRWGRQLAILWAGQCASIGGATFVFPFLPLMVETVGVRDRAQVALWSGGMVAVTQVAMALFAPFWGRIADRVGRKPMLVRAMAGGGLVFIACGLAPNVYVLFALRFAQGALSGTISATTALVASTAPRERVAHSLGVVQSASYIGTTLGPALGAVLVPVVGIRPAFAIAGTIPLTAALWTAIGVREHFVRPEAHVLARGTRATLRDAGVVPAVVTLAVSALLVQAVGSALAPALPLRVARIVGPSHVASAVGAVFAVQAGAAAVAALTVSRVARLVGYRRIIVGAALWTAACYGSLSLVDSLAAVAVATGLGGLAGGSLMPSVNTLLGRVAPAAVRAEVFGYAASAMAIGGAVSPIASTTLVAARGTQAPFLMVAAIEATLALWAGWRLRRLRP